jgi:hypothetical protein
MTSAFGGNDADGRWTQRDSFELLEHATALYLREKPYALESFADVTQAHALVQRLPTQTVRSEAQIAWQQFSTPADIAALAVLLADVGPQDVVLEPSAGNGLLVAQLGDHRSLQLNELDPTRRSRLAALFPEALITGYDGAAIGSLMVRQERPSIILMNPPFSRSLGRGADDLAAVRHLQAALRHLAPGGRLVAIMPDWFGPNARMRDHFETVLREASVRTSLRLEKCYTKHGTSIAVRVFVIDKVAGNAPPAVIQRASVEELAAVLTVPPRAAPPVITAPVRAAPVPAKGISLFRAVKSASVKPRAYFAPARNDVLPVDYERLEAPAPLLEQTGVYLPYRPSRIVFDKAGEHPTALVESVAMGSIAAPIPHYVPRLPERTVSERLLSASQLETVVYAGHAWSQTLPGRFKPDKEGAGLVLAEDGRTYRKGFSWATAPGPARAGRSPPASSTTGCRASGATSGSPRTSRCSKMRGATGPRSAASRPMSSRSATGRSTSPSRSSRASCLSPIRPCARRAAIIAGSSRSSTGRARISTASSSSTKRTRWAASPAGRGSGAKAGSQQGICGVLLQNHLPGARVGYASATGASDINNLAYAVRLGLWGPETSFPIASSSSPRSGRAALPRWNWSPAISRPAAFISPAPELCRGRI